MHTCVHVCVYGVVVGLYIIILCDDETNVRGKKKENFYINKKKKQCRKRIKG